MPARPSRDVSVKLRSPTDQSAPAATIRRMAVREPEVVGVPVQLQPVQLPQKKPPPQHQAAAAAKQQQQHQQQQHQHQQLLQGPHEQPQRLLRCDQLQHPPHAGDHARQRAAGRSGNVAVDGGHMSVGLISRKPRSVAYFLDMEGPEERKRRLAAALAAAAAGAPPGKFCHPRLSAAPLPSLRSPTTSSFEASSTAVTARLARTVVAPPRPSDAQPQFRNCPVPSPHPPQPRAIGQTDQDLAAALEAKCSRASARRAALLRERSQALRRRFEMVRHRALLQQHRRHITAVRFRAYHEFSMSAAFLKRQLLIRQRATICGAAVERAHGIALLSRLRKEVKLRRAYSESLAGRLRDSAGVDAPARAARGRSASVSANAVSSDRYLSSSGAQTRSRSATISHVRMASHPAHQKHTSAAAAAAAAAVNRLASSSDAEEPAGEEDLRSRRNSVLLSSAGSHVPEGTLEWEQWLQDARESVQEPLLSATPLSRRGSLASAACSDPGPDKDVLRLSSILSSVQEVAGEDLRSWDEELALARRIKELRPPITRTTLAELDLEEMEQNAQLRHDLVFDPKLEFRPNLAGEAGAAKRARWESYWSALRLELEGSEGAGGGDHVPCTTRVPVLVFEIRQILEMVLDCDSLADLRQEIRSRTDVGLIAQELAHGAFDIPAFVGWLASILRSHCRPERVAKVDRMVEAADQGRYAEAFKVVFEVLELMKLDIANFQLTHIFRPLAVQSSIQYEWENFKLQLEAELTTLDRTVAWLKLGAQRNPGKPFDETFFECVVNAVTKSYSDTELPEPETFHMDGSRLHSFYNDYQDISVVATILLLFRQLAGPRCGAEAALEMKSGLWVLLLDPDTTMPHISAHLISGAERARGKEFSAAERRVAEGLIDKTLIAGSKLLEMIKDRVAQVLTAYLVVEGKKRAAPPAAPASLPPSPPPPPERGGATSPNYSGADEPEARGIPDPAAPGRRPASSSSPLPLPSPLPPPPSAQERSSRKPAGKLDAAMLVRFGLVDLEENLRDLAERVLELANHNRCVYHPAYHAIWEHLDEFDEDGDGDGEAPESA